MFHTYQCGKCGGMLHVKKRGAHRCPLCFWRLKYLWTDHDGELDKETDFRLPETIKLT